MLSSSEIRKQFIDFFIKKNHELVRSSPVLPIDDPTLLFTNAGMNQFKPYFIGNQISKFKRVVNSQKCIRVSGKHNDLEEVGVDNYHHTFFEMLGNWSFGDYYKKEAIIWSWELLTKVWQLDKKRLWVTIYKDDDETGKIWKKFTDIDSERIIKFGNKDNFWEMGDTGPCGPCTEIHYYTGENVNLQNHKGVNKEQEYREIWNLVFIQYNRNVKGDLEDLPEKHVDTGAGFERLVAILNGKISNYDTDLFIPIIEKIINISKKPITFEGGVPHRVIADHIRMLTFSIADGVMPSNEGRGYVLRRVLRRAARFGRKLSLQEPFIYKLVEPLCKIMGSTYPELLDKKMHVQKVIQAEETSFNKTLDRGLDEFDKLTSIMPKGKVVSGKDAFKLYDTYGFPLDLTELISRENGYKVDVSAFDILMKEQRQRARKSGGFKQLSDGLKWKMVLEPLPTNFLGYTDKSLKAKIIKYRISDKFVEIVLDQTPFYAESGGQVSDKGYLQDDNFSFKVEDVQNKNGEYIHYGFLESGNLESVNIVEAEIDIARRDSIRRNHTATHLLHQSLKDVLGGHVQQAGSLVGPELLRFDLTHYEKISQNQIFKIQEKINKIILSNINVSTEIKDYEQACKEGALGLFGEKYDDSVRVIDIPGFSKELCGGTHVNRTGDIGCISIISESALASGIRRIVAVTGDEAYNLIKKQKCIIIDIQNELKCSESEIITKIKSMVVDYKNLEKKNQDIKQKDLSKNVQLLVDKSKKISNYKLIVKRMDNVDDLRILGDQFRNYMKNNGIVLIGAEINKKPMIMCAITDDLIEKINASQVVKELGKFMGGGGGGKPHLATAGGGDLDKLDKVLDLGKNNIYKKLI